MKKITDKAIKKFREYLICEEKAKATAEKYIRDLTAFAVWLGSRELSKAEVLEYKEYLIENYAPASVNSVISSLNSFFDYSGQYALKVKSLKIQRRYLPERIKSLPKPNMTDFCQRQKAKATENYICLCKRYVLAA